MSQARQKSKQAIAVLISDVHYSIPTLPLAGFAMRKAVTRANFLSVPLIVAGDIHDTKANLRGECVAAMIDDLGEATDYGAYVLVGNHDKINERGEAHSLDFLRAYVTVIDTPDMYSFGPPVHFIPYQHDLNALRTHLKTIPKGSIVIMHQGVSSATSEGYPHDRTAIEAEAVAGLRVISGHYHRRQTIDLPDGGKWDYIGNPYTLNFGEASEPEKGFQVLYDDGSLEFVPTNLRKHVVLDFRSGDIVKGISDINPEDLLWVKVRGPAPMLAKVTKKALAVMLKLPTYNFRLDLIPDKVEATATEKAVDSLTQGELLDEMINGLNADDPTKQRLCALWKELDANTLRKS